MLKGLAITFGVWLVGAMFIGGGILQPEHCPAVTVDSLDRSAFAAAEWIERTQHDDGRYLYEWNAEDDTFPDDYNMVRHAGVTMSLYQMAANGDERALETADRGMQWMIDNLHRHDGWAALRNPDGGDLKLGSSSLMAAGLMLRREATGDEQYDQLARELGDFLVTMQRDDGSFLNFWSLGDEEPVAGITSKYATGEAFWALAMMHEAFPGEGWDDPTWAVADYLALERDAVEEFKYPPWADQWASYGLSVMANWGLEEHHIEYAESLAERFGLLIRSESQRRDSLYSSLTRGPEARAAGMGTWVEGLTSLWILAGEDDRLSHIRDDIAERAVCGAGMLQDRQVEDSEAEEYARPDIARGAWFDEGVTRMDDQQHAISGLILTQAIIEERSAE